MTILNDLKAFLVSNSVVTAQEVVFNFDDYKSFENKLILLCNGGEYSDIARKTTVSIIVKNESMADAETLINDAFDKFCPPKQYEKPLSVNGKMMLLKAVEPPFYKEKEKNGRHVYMFDLNIIHKR